MIKVKPAMPGAHIPFPDRAQPLSAEGERVEESSYWNRLLMEGDVLRVAEPLSEQED